LRVGWREGDLDGSAVGSSLGLLVGSDDGDADGFREGTALGSFVGSTEGDLVGFAEGDELGIFVGAIQMLHGPISCHPVPVPGTDVYRLHSYMFTHVKALP
jgi:hypothetical protein